MKKIHTILNFQFFEFSSTNPFFEGTFFKVSLLRSLEHVTWWLYDLVFDVINPLLILQKCQYPFLFLFSLSDVTSVLSFQRNFHLSCICLKEVPSFLEVLS